MTTRSAQSCADSRSGRPWARSIGLKLLVLIAVVPCVILIPPREQAAASTSGYGWTTNAVTSASTVKRGGRITVTATIRSRTTRSGRVVILVRDPAGRRVMSRVWVGTQFQAGVARRFSATWRVPRREPLGAHSVHVTARRTARRGPTHRHHTGFRVLRRACGVAAPIGARASLPLRVASGRRHLVGANGVPFLMQGDAAWSLMAELSRQEVETYLQDRARRGFNTLLVSLIEHHFSSDPPNNAYGDGPFTTPGDFSTPNPAYFEHVDWVLRRAQQLGFVVLLTPAYAGFDGDDEGWWREVEDNGTAKMRNYGRFLGHRYRNLSNVIWVQAGDFDPPRRGLFDALAEGIAETDPGALQTVHTAPETDPMEYWPTRTWLRVNNVYTYGETYAAAIEEYRRSTRPFFLLESTYENEHDVSTRQLRTQAYHAMLAGSTGHVFGNNPIWHFSSGGLFTPPPGVTWQTALGGPGSRGMAVAGRLLRSTPWWNLRPDLDDRWLVAGEQSGQQRAVAAVSCNRRLFVAYVPTTRTISVDLRQLAGATASFTWYDPTNGAARPVIRRRTTARFQLATPGRNHGGATDWLLIARVP